jgi:hypothetical protein
MSDYQDFPEGGVIMGFSGGDVGVVFCERSIYRMAFEGPPTIFRFDRIAAQMGCRASRSIAAYENLIFFLSHDGFYMVRGASEIVPIGVDKIDRWFAENVNEGVTYKITSAIDPMRKLYVVGFPSGASTTADKVLVYHWPTGQWSTGDWGHDLLYSASKQGGVTIDGLDAIAATIDTLPYTIDSIFYSGTYNVALSGFDSLHRSGFFEGENAEAQIETGDVQLESGYKSMLRGLRVMIDGSNLRPSVIIRSRNNLHEPLVDSVAAQVTNSGNVPVRVSARYHRAKTVIPASTDWIHASGINDIQSSRMGAR